MNESVSGVKKVDVFNDIVSRLEDSKRVKVSDDVVDGMKNYYNNKQEYRDRVELLSKNLKGIKPVDSEVNSVIYLSNYVEKGIAIKTSILSFKQIWVEYRLIFNENAYMQDNNNFMNVEPFETNSFGYTMPKLEIPSYDENLVKVDYDSHDFSNVNESVSNAFDNDKFNNYSVPVYDNIPVYNEGSSEVVLEEKKNDFDVDMSSFSIDDLSKRLDDNYKKLYTKVVDINKYVDSFNKKKIELDRQIASLEERKNNLSRELRELENAKKEFSRYKEVEEKKIVDMKNDVNNKVVSLQNLIDNLDNILGKIN